MIKTKEGFILRKLGKEYLVVAVGKAGSEFHGMIKMNETGAFYWKEFEKGISKTELAEKTMKHFEDLSFQDALSDIEEFLKSIEFAVEDDELS